MDVRIFFRQAKVLKSLVKPWKLSYKQTNLYNVRYVGGVIIDGELFTPDMYDEKLHSRYRPKLSSSGLVRTETARYLRDLGIKFGQISNKSPLHCISLFSNYDLDHTKRNVDFLKSAGLDNDQICHIIMKRPYILLRSTSFMRERVQNIREELDLTKKETLNLIWKQPNILNDAVALTDVQNKRFQLKRKFEISNEEFLLMVERDPRFLFHSWEFSTLPILDYLAEEFVFSDQHMKKILLLAPSVIGTESTAKLESQVDLFLNYMGFSEKGFKEAIPDYPHLLVYRQRLLKLKFNIINKTGVFTWEDIARAPLTLGYSAERIYMRLNFLKFLGKLEKGSFRLSSVLALMEKKYLSNIAQSSSEEYEEFKKNEIDNVRKMRNEIRTKIIHTELDLLLDDEEKNNTK
eukprot:gene12285-13550_t